LQLYHAGCGVRVESPESSGRSRDHLGLNSLDSRLKTLDSRHPPIGKLYLFRNIHNRIGIYAVSGAAVSMFAKPKENRVHSFLLKLLNSFSADALRNPEEGQRSESRVNVVTVVLVIPMEDGKLQVRDAFSAITKNVSSGGAAIVLDQPRWFEQAAIGFSYAGHMTFLRGRARYS
jgi:hypothetical protein